MGNDLQNCKCGSSNLEVEWEELEEQVGFTGSISYLEYYVECYDYQGYRLEKFAKA